MVRILLENSHHPNDVMLNVSHFHALNVFHLDLFFPTKEDPPCAIEARKIEKMNVMKWIQQHNEMQK